MTPARRRAAVLVACALPSLVVPALAQGGHRPFDGVLHPDTRPILFVSGDVRLLIPRHSVTNFFPDGTFPDRPGWMAGAAPFPGPRGVERDTVGAFRSVRFFDARGVVFGFRNAQSDRLDGRGFFRDFLPDWRDPARRWAPSEVEGLLRLK